MASISSLDSHYAGLGGDGMTSKGGPWGGGAGGPPGGASAGGGANPYHHQGPNPFHQGGAPGRPSTPHKPSSVALTKTQLSFYFQEAVVHRRSSHRRWEERGVGSLRHTNTTTERTQTYRI